VNLRLVAVPFIAYLAPMQNGSLQIVPRSKAVPGVLLTVAFVVFLCAAYWITNRDFYMSETLHEYGDLAANALQVERALQNDEYLGPYSRYHFRHPGPISFYYFAQAQRVLTAIPTPLGRTLTADLLLNATLLCLLSAWLYSSGNNSISALVFPASIVCGMLSLPHVYKIYPAISSFWGPYMVILPVVVFIYCCSQIVGGSSRYLPFAAITGVIALHNHIGTTSVIVPLTVLILIMTYRFRTRHHQHLVVPVTVSLVIVVVSFIPPLYEQLTVPQGNLDKLLRFMFSSASREFDLAPIGEIASYFLLRPVAYVLGAARIPVESTAFQLFAGAVLVSVNVLVFPTLSRALQYFCGTVWVTLALILVASTRIMGTVHPYLIAYTVGLVSILYAFPLGWLLDRLRRSCPRKFAPLISVLVFCGFAASGLVWIRNHPLLIPTDDRQYERIQQQFDLVPTKPVAVILEPSGADHDLWREMAALCLRFRRDEYKVYASDFWAFLLGEAMRWGEEPAQVLVLTKNTRCIADAVVAFDTYSVVYAASPRFGSDHTPRSEHEHCSSILRTSGRSHRLLDGWLDPTSLRYWADRTRTTIGFLAW